MYHLMGTRKLSTVETRVFGEAVTVYAVIAAAVGAVWIGKTIGQLLVWLMDEEGYWVSAVVDAQSALAEAEAKLENIRANIAEAQRHDQNAIITDDPNAGSDSNSSSWF